MKKILALRGVRNTGKSSTLKKIPDLLKRKYPNAKIEHFTTRGDIKVVITFGRVKIGIESQGDPSSRLFESLDEFVRKGCKIIVCATRTKGATVEAVENLKRKYEILWLEKEKETASEQYEVSNSKMAKKIVSEIKKAI